MTDEIFLDYCAIHSRTERALFHRDHVARLMLLSGSPPISEERLAKLPEWIAVHSDVADTHIEMARARLKRSHLRVIQGGKT